MERGIGLPFSLEGHTVRWVRNSIEEINPALGRGMMSMGGGDIEIWTRLLLGFGDCWVGIENVLDENGCCFHREMPAGEFIAVLE
ncbi:MAG: hypothetical protein JWQ98_2365 [Chlorobi bacterium]|nr:hypothetical protein [Chlorobiota bacterium]